MHSKKEKKYGKAHSEELSKQRGGGEDKVPCHNPEDYPLGTRQGRLKEARKKAVT